MEWHRFVTYLSNDPHIYIEPFQHNACIGQMDGQKSHIYEYCTSVCWWAISHKNNNLSQTLDMITSFIQTVGITGVRAVWQAACWFPHCQWQTVSLSRTSSCSSTAQPRSMKTCAAWLRLWRLLLITLQCRSWSTKSTSTWLWCTVHDRHRRLATNNRRRCTPSATGASAGGRLLPVLNVTACSQSGTQ